MNKLLLTLIGGLLFTIGCSSGGDTPPEEAENDPPVATLAWDTVPGFEFTEGVAVDLDLRDYLTDTTDAATITLSEILPDGLRFTTGVIDGTPSAETPSRDFVATATDGGGTLPDAVSNNFSIEVTVGVVPSDGITFERATPEQIGIYIPVTDPLSSLATATVRYRPAIESVWRTAHPLLRIHPEWISGGAPVSVVDAFAGSIFDLEPGTAYDVEVTITPPTGDPEVMVSEFTTRALPVEGVAATVTGTTADNLQSLLDALSPGDVLDLSAGTYEVDGLHLDVSGTAVAPITIRGVDRESVVLHDPTGTILQFQHASHIIIEDITLKGAGTDSGTSASSMGASFWDGTLQEYVTFRRLDFEGVDKGIIGWKAVNSVLIYDCVLTGNNEWTEEFVASSLTWNDDGIRLPGEGNCAFDNTLHGFGDTFAVNDRVFSAAVYFYRNLVTMTGDDACEGDYGTRNLAFYDNHIANCSTFLSLDPVWGGPLYAFRNVCVNTYRGPFKFNSTNSGHLVYSNTIVRTEGRFSWGWVQFNNGPQRNWSYRNNLLVYHGSGGLMAFESSGNDPIDYTNNGWYPDSSIWWSTSGGSFSSLADTFAGLPGTEPVFSTSTQRHEADIVLPREPFTTTIPLGSDHWTEITSLFVPALSDTSGAQNAGVAIPGITDGHSGAAPDMGAIIAGRTSPTWGATR